MNSTAFFAVLIVLILGVIYVMKGTDNPPETGVTHTPKEYIEYVERMNQAKATAKLMTESQEQLQEQAEQALEAASRQR